MTPEDKKLRRLIFGPSPLGKAAMKLQQWRTGLTTYEIHRRPYCDDPVPVHKEEPRNEGVGYVGLSFDMTAPCRRCEKCLLYRALKWRERMTAECVAWPRTWVVALTFDPVHLAGVVMESYRFSGLSADAAVERAAYGHVSKYLKRLRKAGARFRFSGVPEYGGKHGRLHYHLLLHETIENSLTKRRIDGQWRSFTHARLVSGPAGSEAASRYVSKYLTKSLLRPRASEDYGKPEKWLRKQLTKQNLTKQSQ